MRIGSLFSGYGGLDIAVQSVLGGDLAWYSEIEPAACTVLAAHHPGVPNLGDITAVDWAAVEPVDVLTGGYPCQPFSHAGKRKGTNDERHLWPYVRDAIRVLRPRITVLENVRGHLTLGFDAVLADLAELGMSARWGVVRAADAGAPHGRARLFIVVTDADCQGRQGAVALPDGRVRPERLGHAVTGAGQSPTSDAGSGPLAGTAAAGHGLPVAAERGDLAAADASSAERRGAERAPVGEAAGSAAEPGERAGAAADAARRGSAAQRASGPSEAGAAAGADGGCEYGVGAAADAQGGRWGAGPRPATQSGGHQEPRTGNGSGVDWGKYAPAIHRWESVLGRPAPSPTIPGANGRPRLSPAFVEWMMGLPAGHVTGHGLRPAQELKMLGNGVVPQQAALALRMLGVAS